MRFRWSFWPEHSESILSLVWLGTCLLQETSHVPDVSCTEVVTDPVVLSHDTSQSVFAARLPVRGPLVFMHVMTSRIQPSTKKYGNGMCDVINGFGMYSNIQDFLALLSRNTQRPQGSPVYPIATGAVTLRNSHPLKYSCTIVSFPHPLQTDWSSRPPSLRTSLDVCDWYLPCSVLTACTRVRPFQLSPSLRSIRYDELTYG